jgi:hypothetical protein
MIPYDELVVALQTWRAKQGLPVGQLSGALTPPSVKAPVFVPPAPAGFAPRATPPAAPPPRNQGFLGNVATPPPLATLDDSLDVDESALIEESHYESEGDDFALAFDGTKLDHDPESTAIGSAPAPRLSDPYGQPTDPGADGGETEDRPVTPGHNRNEDW